MVGIFQIEENLQRLKEKLKSCNDGKCPITRQGLIHLLHSKNKVTVNYQQLFILLMPIFMLGIITSLIETDDNKVAFLNSVWLAIGLGIASIWLTIKFSENQLKHERWSRYSQHATSYYYDKEWELAIENYNKSLEFIHDDIQALNNTGAALIELEKYVDAIPYFKRILEINSENTAALSNMAYCFQQLTCFDEAIKSYEKAIRLRPDYSDAINNLGTLYLDQYRHALALEQFEDAIGIDPSDPMPWTNKAIIFNELKQFEDAIFACNESLKIEPKYTEALIQKAIALFHLKQFEEIISVGNTYLKLKPLHTKQNPKKLEQNKILFYMGVSLAISKKFETALQHFDEYLVIIPYDKQALRYKGDCLVAIKDYPNAIEAYDDSLRIDPYQPEVLSNKAIALWNSRKFIQSLMCLNEALKIRPSHSVSHYNKGNFLSSHKDNIDIVNEAHQLALQNNSQDIDDILHKAKSSIFLGNSGQAIKLLNELLEIDQKNLEALYLKAQTFREQEKFDDAILVFDRILEFLPNDIHALADKGLNFASKGDYDTAIKIYNEALQIEPKSAVVLMNKGVALTTIGHSERAIGTCFDVIIKENPVDFNAIYSKGKALFKQKKFQKALDSYTEAIEIKPNDYGSYMERGNCFLELGQYENAIKEYRIVEYLKPDEIVVNVNLSIAYAKWLDYPNAWKYWYQFLDASKIDHKWLDKLVKQIKNFGIYSIKLKEIGAVLVISF